MHQEVIQRLKELGNEEFAAHHQRFFKTGKGEYGEGDVFLGIRVPMIRRELKTFPNLSLSVLSKLLRSKYHEVRFFALVALSAQFKKGDNEKKEKIYQLYLKEKKHINNWDLVDISAPHIVGAFLFNEDRSILYQLAESKSLWDRRIAVLSTFYFIRQHDFKDTFQLSEILLNNEEDLMHKAIGWMLREIGNRNLKKEEIFLKKHYKKMPRTMLRYAIEKFEEEKRQQYLKGLI